MPFDTQPGAPSGVWCRTARTDYLYYERRTSPFHQAHILLHLAACLQLSDRAGLTIDAALVPGLDPQLARLILGEEVQVARPGDEAENMAVLAMGRIVRRPSRLAARLMLRQLEPLRAALLAAVPEAARRSVQADPRGRLHQAVVEIRDAALALRPYWDNAVLDGARGRAAAAGLAGLDRAAEVEAAVLAGAVRGRAAGVSVSRDLVSGGWQHMPGQDLGSEAAWLVRVARAFARDRSGVQPLRGTFRSVPRSAWGWRVTGMVAAALGSHVSP